MTFYQTKKDGSGQDVIGSVTLLAGHLAVEGGDGLADLLFDRGQREAGPAAMEATMREAPLRFDGAYLRAGFEE